MSGDNFSEGVSKPRVVMGDISNQPLKRGHSSNLGLKSGDGFGKKVVEDGDSFLAKKVCLGVESSVKGKCQTNFGVENSGEKGLSQKEDKQPCESGPTDSDIDASQENIVSVKPHENKEISKFLDVSKSAGEGGDASRDSCGSSGSIPTNSSSSKKDSDDEVRLNSDVKEINLVDDVEIRGDKDHGVGGLDSCNHGSVNWLRLPNPQGLVGCTALKDDGHASFSSGADLLKACPCSFCLKAAYILSDLRYQDIKGQIAAIKKSQKEASILVNKYARENQADIHSQENSKKYSKLESDLSAQWRSLFHHMEDIFVNESNQLHNKFLALKDLRENCKMDLEGTTGMPSDNLQGFLHCKTFSSHHL